MTSEKPLFSVLGADGDIGRALCAHLARKGFPFRRFGRDHDGRDLGPLGHAVYCIGLTQDFAQRPFDTVEAHVGLFARLVRDAAFHSLTYLSSTRLYDAAGGHGDPEQALCLDPGNPRHLYDLSKALGESLCLTGGRSGVRAARLACVYDPALGADNHLHGLLRQAVRGETVRMNGNPHIARDYVAIDDVCESLVAIALHGRRQIYNVASGETLTNAALAGLLAEAGIPVSTAWDFHQDMPAAPSIDIRALSEDFGLRPRRLRETLPPILARLEARNRATAIPRPEDEAKREGRNAERCSP